MLLRLKYLFPIGIYASLAYSQCPVTDTWVNPLDGGWSQACPDGKGFDNVHNCITQAFGRASDNNVPPFNTIPYAPKRTWITTARCAVSPSSQEARKAGFIGSK